MLCPALLIRAVLPALKETGERVVLTGGVAGLVHTPGDIYGATTWAVAGPVQNTRRMVTGDGVGANLIVPGRVEAPFRDGLGSLSEGRPLTADQIAGSVVRAVGRPEGIDVDNVIIRPADRPTRPTTAPTRPDAPPPGGPGARKDVRRRSPVPGQVRRATPRYVRVRRRPVPS